MTEREDWVEEVANLIEGSDWGNQVEALEGHSLLQIARRCERAESVNWGANFVRIMAECFFAAKVNG